MPLSDNFRFGKSQKLKSRKTISLIFSSGKYKIFHPLCFYWLESENIESKETRLFGVSVPKSKFKKAVDRNLLKRRMREAYRLNRPIILSDFTFKKNGQIGLMVVYIDKEIKSYQIIEKKMIQGMSFIFKES